MVECLSSYIHRLAEAHGLPTWILVCKELAPRFGQWSLLAETSESPCKPVDAARLKAMLPERIGGYSRTSMETQSMGAGNVGGAQATALYEMGDRSVRVELTDMAVKQGSTGTLVFATTVSRIYAKGRGGAETLAIEEERRGVFREEVKPGERNQAPRREEAPRDTPWRRTVTPDAVVLFRFSALTFNSHRIHYDRTWAMEVEGYPGLVVHGPFTATQLVDFARDHANGRAITSFTAQARAPLFDTAPFELRGQPSADGKSADLWAVTPEGTIAVTAQVELQTKYARRSGFAI